MNAFYVVNLLVYAAVDAMACLGLSQQFGVAGVTNFGFIIFQAAGGYATYDKAAGRYSLSEEQAFALADENSPAYLPGAFVSFRQACVN